MSQIKATNLDNLKRSHRGLIGIISMGDMGRGIARLLTTHGYAVITNCRGRSQDTINRAHDAGAHLVDSDEDLLHANLILSIVPPTNAHSTAERIVSAASTSPRQNPTLYFADLNAVSPATIRSISSLFSSSPIKFIDGAILGGPPSVSSPPPPPSRILQFSTPPPEWNKPLIPTSGTHSFSSVFPSDPGHLPAVLNAKHLSDDIGAASGLKMTFASLNKGYAAIAVQAATTARNLGVLDHLKSALKDIMGEAWERRFEKAVTGMPPKAGRWVREMEEIAATHQVDGGLEPTIFLGAAEVFRTVAEDTVLGAEKIGKRNRGMTAEDVGTAVAEGLAEKKKRETQGEEKGGSEEL